VLNVRARQFIDAVLAHDFEAAEALLDPDVETVTPRGTLSGVAACRQVLEKASGDAQFATEQTEPEFEEIEGAVVARTHEIARWRETGEVAYERDFALRLTLGDESIVRVVVMPGGRPRARKPQGRRLSVYLLCVFGHRWKPVERAGDHSLMLVCRHCGKTRPLSMGQTDERSPRKVPSR